MNLPNTHACLIPPAGAGDLSALQLCTNNGASSGEVEQRLLASVAEPDRDQLTRENGRVVQGHGKRRRRHARPRSACDLFAHPAVAVQLGTCLAP